jgi:hypothetical protein
VPVIISFIIVAALKEIFPKQQDVFSAGDELVAWRLIRIRGSLPETFPFREPERPSTRAAVNHLNEPFAKAARSLLPQS